MQRVFQKIKTILDKEKSEIPRFYLRTLMNLEDFVKDVSYAHSTHVHSSCT